MKKTKDKIKDNPEKMEELGFIGQFPLGWKVLKPKKKQNLMNLLIRHTNTA